MKASRVACSSLLSIFMDSKFPIVQESVDEILRLSHQPNSNPNDFKLLRTIYANLLDFNTSFQSIWLYVALTFKTTIPIEMFKDSLDTEYFHFPDVENLGHLYTIKCIPMGLLGACYGRSKCVALMAPAVYELFNVVAAENKSNSELEIIVDSLVDIVVGYQRMFHLPRSLKEEEEEVRLVVPELKELVTVWTEGGITAFFPLVSEDIRMSLSGDDGCEIGYLAGVVTAELFFLKLCLMIWKGGAELEKELIQWAIQFITGCGRCCFFDILLKLLLEPKFPIKSLLDLKDEALLRKVLYDAVILEDYSFLYSDKAREIAAYNVKDLPLSRLNVFHEAVQFSRNNGDHTVANSYIDAFSEFQLPAKLIKWVSNQIGTDVIPSKVNAITPRDFIEWLLRLEIPGMRVYFYKSVSKLHSNYHLRPPSFFQSIKGSGGEEVDGYLICIGTESGPKRVRRGHNAKWIERTAKFPRQHRASTSERDHTASDKMMY